MKNILSFAAFGLLAFPIMAHAAWYNPLTWFRHDIIEISTSTPPESVQPEIKVVEVEGPTKEVQKIVPVDRVVEKVVTKTIENPDTLALVDQLYKENQDLKANVTNLTSTVLNLNDTVNRYVGVINSLQSQLQALGQTANTSVPDISNPYPDARIEVKVGMNLGYSTPADAIDSLTVYANPESRQYDDTTVFIKAYLKKDSNSQGPDSGDGIYVETTLPEGIMPAGSLGGPGIFQGVPSGNLTDISSDKYGKYYPINLTPKTVGNYTLNLSSAKYGVSKTITIHVVARN